MIKIPYCENCGAYKDSIHEICNKCGMVRASENDIDPVLKSDAPSTLSNNLSSQSCEETKISSSSQQDNKKRKDRIILSVLILGLVCIAALSIWGILQSKYNNAQKCLLIGEYDEAYKKYTSLGSYRDSDILAKESLYQKYVSFLNEGDYLSAIDGFDSLDNYSDSENYMKAARYGYASQLFNQSEYDNAKVLFDVLGDYSDSKAKSKECIYKIAISLYQEKRWYDAKNNFSSLGNSYAECGAYIALCDYRIAKETIDNSDDGDIKALRNVFSSLSKYDNSECKKARADGLFTIMKLYNYNFSNGNISIKIYKNEKEPDCCWMTYNNLWEMWGHKYWGYEENRGKYGMFTYTKDGESYVDWFEIVAFDDPYSDCPATVTIKNPNNGKEYVLKRR